jgi:hypothetical protein
MYSRGIGRRIFQGDSTGPIPRTNIDHWGTQMLDHASDILRQSFEVELDGSVRKTGIPPIH